MMMKRSFHKLKLGLAALALATLPGTAHAADSLFSWEDLQFLKIYHAYSASDGKTYIEEIQVPARTAMSGGKPSQLYLLLKPHSIAIARSAHDSMIDWHFAGEFRHLLIPLQGDLVFDLGDGKLFHLKAGEAMLAEDWTGKGHRSGCMAVNLRSCAVIDVSIDPTKHEIPLRAPPTKP